MSKVGGRLLNRMIGVFVCSCSCSSVTSPAQETTGGIVQGTVKDPSGAVPCRTRRLAVANGFARWSVPRRFKTDASGYYRFA